MREIKYTACRKNMYCRVKPGNDMYIDQSLELVRLGSHSELGLWPPVTSNHWCLAPAGSR
jgi:hypothetical protein